MAIRKTLRDYQRERAELRQTARRTYAARIGADPDGPLPGLKSSTEFKEFYEKPAKRSFRNERRTRTARQKVQALKGDEIDQIKKDAERFTKIETPGNAFQAVQEIESKPFWAIANERINPDKSGGQFIGDLFDLTEGSKKGTRKKGYILSIDGKDQQFTTQLAFEKALRNQFQDIMDTLKSKGKENDYPVGLVSYKTGVIGDMEVFIMEIDTNEGEREVV